MVSMSLISSYLQSKKLPKSQQLRLVIERGGLSLKKHSEISIGARFKAWIGLEGNATFRTLCKFINTNSQTIFRNEKSKNDLYKFNKFIIQYNKSHVCWKKAKKIQTKKFGFPSEALEKQAISTFNRLNDYFSTLSNVKASDPESIEKLIEFLRSLRAKISELDPSLKSEQIKLLINETLKLKNKIKGLICVKNFVLNNDFRDSLEKTLKELQITALNFIFKNKIDKQKTFILKLQNSLEGIAVTEQESKTFLLGELKRWNQRLAKGKTVAIPKWYHCTKQMNVLSKIATDRIIVSHKKLHKGAFVANVPERLYGPLGVAMSDKIEKQIDSQGNVVFPIKVKTLGEDNVVYNNAFTPTQIKLEGNDLFSRYTVLWIGFQKSIRLQRRLKNENPLAYYKDAKIAYLYYDHETLSPNKVATLAHKIRVRALTLDQVDKIRRLIDSTFKVNLPANWQGNVRMVK